MIEKFFIKKFRFRFWRRIAQILVLANRANNEESMIETIHRIFHGKPKEHPKETQIGLLNTIHVTSKYDHQYEVRDNQDNYIGRISYIKKGKEETLYFSNEKLHKINNLFNLLKNITEDERTLSVYENKHKNALKCWQRQAVKENGCEYIEEVNEVTIGNAFGAKVNVPKDIILPPQLEIEIEKMQKLYYEN